jgi:hypothetical protein
MPKLMDNPGSCATISRDPVRFLAPYAKQFVEELVAHCRRAHRRRFPLKPPPLPKALTGNRPFTCSPPGSHCLLDQPRI